MTTKALPSPQTYDIPDHPLAQIFPMMGNEDRTELRRRIKENGLREDIVLLDGLVIDGRNRLVACKTLGLPARFRNYDESTDGDPLGYVIDHNLRRRHLNTSQRAAVAADLMERFKAADAAIEASELAAMGGENGAEDGDQGGTTLDTSDSQELPSGDDSSQTKRAAIMGEMKKAAKKAASKSAKAKKPAAGKTRDKAAKIMNVSPRSVQKAATLKKQDPKKFAEVKKGDTGLNAASAEVGKREKDKLAYDDAMARIQAIAGAGLAGAIREGTRLKRKADVIAFAALSDEDMLNVRGLIAEGWKLADATKYKARTLARTHSIQDLLDRATHAGGLFTLDIQGYTVSVQRKEK